MIPQNDFDHEMRITMLDHVGHDVQLVVYGKPEIHNVALECDTCYVVLLDYETDYYKEHYGEE